MYSRLHAETSSHSSPVASGLGIVINATIDTCICKGSAPSTASMSGMGQAYEMAVFVELDLLARADEDASSLYLVETFNTVRRSMRCMGRGPDVPDVRSLASSAGAHEGRPPDQPVGEDDWAVAMRFV